jgi:putative tryptophan/tyrosine transport system substrate-binding protein
MIWGRAVGKANSIVHQVVPHASRFGLVQSRTVQDSADRCLWTRTCPPGFTVVGVPLDYPIDEAAYRRVFAALTRDRAEAIVVSDEEENQANFRLIPELAEKIGLPAIYLFKMYVEAGGLMSYGPDLSALGQRPVEITDQILKGAKPSEIPIAQPTKIELAVNLKTAKALGLTVPPELLATADEVIE